MLKRRLHAAAAAWLVLPIADAAMALEYCVTCEGPPAIYRCMIDGTEDGPGRDPRVSLYCISEMAKRGGHKSCAVSRGAPFPCPGLTAVVDQPSDLSRPAAPSPEAEALGPDTPAVHEADVEAEPAPQAEKPVKVPRTMEELAGETVKSSKQGLQKAGEAIGGTAKMAGEQIGSAGSAIGNAASKTWACITSLFSSCGEEAEADQLPEHPPVAD